MKVTAVTVKTSQSLLKPVEIAAYAIVNGQATLAVQVQSIFTPFIANQHLPGVIQQFRLQKHLRRMTNDLPGCLNRQFGGQVCGFRFCTAEDYRLTFWIGFKPAG